MSKRVLRWLESYRQPRHWWKNVAWRFPSTISDLNAVFVVGSPRSGTTLLQRMLSLHSELFSISGETGIFTYQNLFDPRRKHFGLPAARIKSLQEGSSDVVDFFRKGVSYLSTEHGGNRFVEKTPQHVLRLPFILKHFPASQVIHVVRDGRDCYCSSRFNPAIPQNRSIGRFARYWKKCVSAPMPHETNDRLFTVRYEHLVSRPRQQMTDVMTFLGLSFEGSQLDSSRIGNDHRANVEGFDRLKQPISAATVNRFESELTKTEISRFEALADRALAYYGYDLIGGS
ncbi:MAG: sulfotransferase [Acidobacteriota bacterium]